MADATVHPRWCDRQGCDERGEHRSRPLHVVPDRGGRYGIHVSLVQLLHPGVPSAVAVTVTDDGVAVEYLLSRPQGRILCHQVRRLLDRSKR